VLEKNQDPECSPPDQRFNGHEYGGGLIRKTSKHLEDQRIFARKKLQNFVQGRT
jgi:hypothetical protein